MLKSQRRKAAKLRGQTMIEFTFCMIIVFLMIYSITKVFEWSGRELVSRRVGHTSRLTTSGGGLTRSYTSAADSEQIAQISPFYSSGVDMNAVWRGGVN